MSSFNSKRANEVINYSNNANFFQGFGNTIDRNTDPLITGYAFIRFIKEVSWVDTEVPGFFRLIEKNFKAFSGAPDTELATVEETAGFSPNASQFASGITKGQGFTMSHNEYSGSPIATGYEAWVSGIRDPNTNIATYPRKYDLEYTHRNHTAQIMYIVTRPDADNSDNENIVEHAVYISNVMPLRIMNNHFQFATGQQEAHVLEQSFTGDFFKGPQILDAAVSIMGSHAPYTFVDQGEVDIATL